MEQTPSPNGDSKQKLKAALERLDLNHVSDGDLLSLESLTLSLGLIFLSLGFLLEYPNLLTLLFAIAVVGWRQFSFFGLQKKSLLGKLFDNKKVNDEVGTWVCSYPLYTNPEDHKPIYEILSENPKFATRSKSERLFLSGVGFTGGQRLLAILATNLGLAYVSEKGELKYIDRRTLNLSFIFDNFKDNYLRVVATQLLLMVLFTVLGMLSAYVIWLVSYVTVFSLIFERQRQSNLREEEAIAVIEAGEEVEAPLVSQETAEELPASPREKLLENSEVLFNQLKIKGIDFVETLKAGPIGKSFAEFKAKHLSGSSSEDKPTDSLSQEEKQRIEAEKAAELIRQENLKAAKSRGDSQELLFLTPEEELFIPKDVPAAKQSLIDEEEFVSNQREVFLNSPLISTIEPPSAEKEPDNSPT